MHCGVTQTAPRADCHGYLNAPSQVVPPAAGNVTQSSSLDVLVRNPTGSARQQLIVFESQLTSVIAGSLGLQSGQVGGVAGVKPGQRAGGVWYG